jgi:hypothetical protein
MGILTVASIILKEMQASLLQLASLLQIRLLSIWAADRCDLTPVVLSFSVLWQKPHQHCRYVDGQHSKARMSQGIFCHIVDTIRS